MSGNERRSAILRAASRLFEHYGHGKTTIADVAREAQVGVGTVYLEFESKDAIVGELSLAAHVDVLAKMRDAARRAGNDQQRLTAAMLARTSAFLQLRTKGEHACELFHCSSVAVRSAHARFEKEERHFLAELLHAGRQAFAGDAVRSAQLVQRAFASLSPPRLYALADEEALVTARSMISLLLRGLLKRPAARALRR